MMKKSRIIISILLCTALISVSVFNLVSSSFAHVRGQGGDYLYGRIPEKTDDEATKETVYDYLVEGGQKILLGALSEAIEIDIGEEGFTVKNSYDEWLEAEGAGSKLTIEMKQEALTPITPDNDINNKQEQETTEIPANSETSESVGEKQSVAELTTIDDEVAGNDGEEADSEDGESSTTPDDNTPSDNPDEAEPSEDYDNIKPESYTVTVTSADGLRSAEFIILAEEPESESVAVLNNDKYYNPAIPIIASAGDADAVISGFPAKTTYTVYEDTYLLYFADMPITVPAGKAAVFDLSNTDYVDALKLYHGAITENSTADFELPYFKVPSVSGDSPVVLGNTALILSLPYKWGNSDKPEITVERCVTDDDGVLSWIQLEDEDDSIIFEEYDATSEVSITANGAEAGSYRATLIWTEPETETELLTYSFPFYVFYPEQTEEEKSVEYQYVNGQTNGTLIGGEEIEVQVTYYCSCEICCEGSSDGITASGKVATTGMVAMSDTYPFGTKILIDGVMYTVEDRGSAITGNRVDIYVPTHEQALRGGVEANTTAIVYLPTENNNG